MEIVIKKSLTSNKGVFRFEGDNFYYETYNAADGINYYGEIPLKFFKYKLITRRIILIKEYRFWWSDIRTDEEFEHAIPQTDYNLIGEKIDNYIKNHQESIKKQKLKIIKEKEDEKTRKENLKVLKSNVISEFDKDGNGQLDTAEVKDDFDKLVKKHQSKIIEIDRSYIQQFVRISNYQKQKRKNLQSIFESINITKDQKELSSQVELLKEQIHSYELLLFHSLNMVISLVEDDMFTFYEIYESFDKLEIFNSNHENEVSKRLINIEGGIYSLMTSIRQMEQNIIGQLGYLTYITQDSFNQLSNNVTRELESINSLISINNLLSGINAYQTYKLRKGK